MPDIHILGRHRRPGSSVSGSVVFSSAAGGTTCRTSLGTSAVVTGSAPDRITLRVTSSTSTSATGTVSLDADFGYSIDAGALRLTCRGPQGPLQRGEYTEVSRILRVNVTVVCINDSDGTRVNATFSGDYNVTQNITVS